MNIQGKPGEETWGRPPDPQDLSPDAPEQRPQTGNGKPAASPLPRKSSGPWVALRLALSSGEASPD